MPRKEELAIIIRAKDEASKYLKTIHGGLRGLREQIFSLKGAIVGLGLGYVLKDIIDTAGEMESFAVQLRSVSASAKEAEQSLKWIREFAEATPFATDEVVQAFVRLKAVGIPVTEDVMKAIGDASFAMNRDIRDVAAALISFETEPLRNLGIEMTRQGDTAVLQSGRIRMTVKNNAKEIRDAIIEVFLKRFPGAMKEAESSWKGLTAIFGSGVDELKADVGETLMPTLKELLKEHFIPLVGEAREWVKANKEMLAQDVEGFFRGVAEAVRDLADAYVTLHYAYEGWQLFRRDMKKEIVVKPGPLIAFFDWMASKAGIGTLEDINKEWGQFQENLKDVPIIRADTVKEVVKAVNDLNDGLGDTTDNVKDVDKIWDATLKRIKESVEERERIEKEARDAMATIHDDYLQYTLSKESYLTYQIGKEYEERKADLVAALEANRISYEEYIEAIREAEEVKNFAIKQGLEDLKGDTDGWAKHMEQVQIQAARNMQDALAEFYFDWQRGEFDDLLNNFVRMLQRMAAEELAFITWSQGIKPIGSAIWGALGSLFGSSALTAPVPVPGAPPIAIAQHGLEITEPIFGIGRSGQRYLFGEAGRERVIPEGTGINASYSMTISVPISIDTINKRLISSIRSDIEEALPRIVDRRIREIM